ncbi:MAG: SRPBCC family protein [Rhodospirillaceae bacterium]|nr:SRPBCC family protein [Rhodospirillaceae bacterium]MBT7232527.1 SRPBCC family protein [Rhodospirillaceae bacterium]
MKIVQEFRIDLSPSTVWRAFTDVALVAECLPGSELTHTDDSGAFEGKMRVKLGPITAAFWGKGVIERNEAAQTGSVEGTGTDSGSGSRAKAKMTYVLTALENEAATRVTVEADIVLSGTFAQFGRSSVIEEVSAHLTGQFVQNLQDHLLEGADYARPAQSAQEIDGIKLLLTIFRNRVQKLFANLRRRLS